MESNPNGNSNHYNQPDQNEHKQTDKGHEDLYEEFKQMNL